MKKLIVFAMLLCIAGVAFAQKKINGKITDEQKKPLEAATITLKDSDGNMVSYTRSNAKGEFVLNGTDKAIYVVEVSLLGYRKHRQELSDFSKTLEIVLKSTEINLKSVSVKNRPRLTANGDTLDYKTSDFADKQDRTIGDVLKRMPGITVSEEGKVSHNGKAISNLYLDKDNLLDDKYNVLTKTIPQGAVDKVQVIENDQPVKMLQKNNTSTDVALNLVMKEEAKLKPMGTVNAGVGTPSKYDANVTAMLFKKNIKFVNNIRGNNIGDDPARDLISFNSSAYTNRVGNTKPDALLSSGAAGVPTLPQRRTLLNNAGLANLNNLYKFNEDKQFRFNFSYLYDTQKQYYDKLSETYLPNQTISYTELQNNRLNPQKLRAQANYNINSEDYYLNNVLLGAYNPTKINSLFVLNGEQATQLLKQENLNFSNEFNLRKKLKSGNMINLYSFLERSSQPEKLVIAPGLNADIINNNLPFALSNQTVDIPAWFTNNYVSTTFVHGKFQHSYRVGHSYQHQNLSSALLLQQTSGESTPAGNDYTNNLIWQKHRAFVDGTYEYSSDKFKATLVMPISYNAIIYEAKNFGAETSLDRFFVNPLLNLKYQTSTENYVSASYSFRNELGDIADIYQGTILKNYRSLFANNAPIAESKAQSVNAAFNFRKAISMVFFNIQLGYVVREMNTISSYILSNSTQQRIVLPLPNSTKGFTASTSGSKYLFALTSTVNAGFSYSNSNIQTLQNGILIPYNSQTFGYNAGIEAKLTKQISWSYNGTFTENHNKATNQDVASTIFRQLQQKSTLSLTLLKDVYLNLSAEHLLTLQEEQPNLKYLFTDANVRYRLGKLKTDLQFGLTNIGNIKTYDAVFLSANSYTRGSYQIIGRMAMARALFNF